MNGKTALAMIMVMIVSLSVIVPVSHASTVKVVLNPNSNEATVDAYINSSLSISASNTSNIGQLILDSILSGPSGKNLTISSIEMNSSSFAFKIINDSIARHDPNASLKSLSLGYQRIVENSTGNGLVTIYTNTSLLVGMVVTGIFYNNSANLSWRSFSTEQGISLNGTEVNQANFNNFSESSSSSVNTLNMSAFSQSLVQWNRTYDQATNVTTFSLNAGKTVDLQYNSSFNGNTFTLKFTIDPAYSISAPGFDSASADSIQISSPPAHNPVTFYAIGAVMVAGIILLMYASRRRGMK